MSEVDNKYLLPFLSNIIESLNNNTITEENKKLVGEFYMKYLFYEKNNDTEITEDDMNKFLFLGYYIYKHLLNDKNLSSI